MQRNPSLSFSASPGTHEDPSNWSRSVSKPSKMASAQGYPDASHLGIGEDQDKRGTAFESTVGEVPEGRHTPLQCTTSVPPLMERSGSKMPAAPPDMEDIE